MKVDMLPCRWRDFLQKSQCFGVFARLMTSSPKASSMSQSHMRRVSLSNCSDVCDSFATVKVRNLGNTEISGSSPLPCSTPERL